MQIELTSRERQTSEFTIILLLVTLVTLKKTWSKPINPNEETMPI